ncbi:hypothetical protein ADIARSV_1825 [Arcticibacter svalbardensis MN12-7]|uniref:Ferrous iron transporter FeoA-like domain-containing protein n=1 Tax=Arcticibacter svalbardensis MN12-7 TaxID=1150600 RepID=R9GTJ7_9SPHI|nr:hypothetical protein ADIARSV_1825 [Arcticibacter svalbardensis MN12-7]
MFTRRIDLVDRFAPLGDPIAITVSGYQLSLRMQEASTIVLQHL